MIPRVGDPALDFTQDSTSGPIRFHEWAGASWVLLFAYRADFDPVCTTELGRVAQLQAELAKRNVKALGLGVDSLAAHQEWVMDINQTQGTEVSFPILADADHRVARAYGLVATNDGDPRPSRSLLLIDPAKQVRLQFTYPPSTGRNFREVLRCIDSLRLTDAHCVATPAEWEPGQNVLIPPAIHGDDELLARFPQGYQTLRPYLRLTPDPAR